MPDPLKAIISDFGPDEIPWEGGQALFNLWTSKRNRRSMPARKDFSPVELKEGLPTTCLIDVQYDPPNFNTRLAGTALVQVMGRDPTGMNQADLPGGEDLVARYQWVLEHKKPYLCLDLPLTWASKDYESYSTLVLPLSDDDDQINMLIANLHLMSRWKHLTRSRAGGDHPFF